MSTSYGQGAVESFYGPTEVLVGEEVAYEATYPSADMMWHPPGGSFDVTGSHEVTGTYEYFDADPVRHIQYLKWTETGSFTVTYTHSATYEEHTITVLVKAAAPPVPNVTPYISTRSCGSATITYNGTPPSGVGWYWQKIGNALSLNLGYSKTLTTSTSGTYYLAAYANGFFSDPSSSVSVTFSGGPAAPSVASASRVGAGNITLSVQAPVAGLTYQWYTSATGVNPDFTGTVLTTNLSASTTFYVSAKDAQGCESQRTAVSATVYEMVQVIASGALIHPEGESVNLLTKESVYTAYEWHKVGVSGIMGYSRVLTDAQPGSYTVTVTYPNGEKRTSSAVEVNLLPVIRFASEPEVGVGKLVSLFLNSTYSGYEWRKDGVVVGQSPGYDASGAGVYSAKVTLKDGSFLEAAPVTLSGEEGVANINYVIEYSVREKGLKNTETIEQQSVDHVNRNITYLDGLGRPLQNVLVKASPLGKDIVTPFTYDSRGRSAQQFLPYAAPSSSQGC